jgi:hypothetical protein
MLINISNYVVLRLEYLQQNETVVCDRRYLYTAILCSLVKAMICVNLSSHVYCPYFTTREYTE